jgi:hypothetical protein
MALELTRHELCPRCEIERPCGVSFQGVQVQGETFKFATPSDAWIQFHPFLHPFILLCSVSILVRINP